MAAAVATAISATSNPELVLRLAIGEVVLTFSAAAPGMVMVEKRPEIGAEEKAPRIMIRSN